MGEFAAIIGMTEAQMFAVIPVSLIYLVVQILILKRTMVNRSLLKDQEMLKNENEAIKARFDRDIADLNQRVDADNQETERLKIVIEVMSKIGEGMREQTSAIKLMNESMSDLKDMQETQIIAVQGMHRKTRDNSDLGVAHILSAISSALEAINHTANQIKAVSTDVSETRDTTTIIMQGVDLANNKIGVALHDISGIAKTTSSIQNMHESLEGIREIIKRVVPKFEGQEAMMLELSTRVATIEKNVNTISDFVKGVKSNGNSTRVSRIPGIVRQDGIGTGITGAGDEPSVDSEENPGSGGKISINEGNVDDEDLH